MSKISYVDLAKMNPGVRRSSEETFNSKLNLDESRAPWFELVNSKILAVLPLGINPARGETHFQYYSWDSIKYEWKESHIVYGAPWLNDQ